MSRAAERRLRIAITGPRGRLGAALCRRYRPHHTVIEIPRSSVDLSRPEAVRDRLRAVEFDVLINTAAFTTVDECERQRELAYDVNAHAAGAMAEVCAEKGARMVQVSTDFVFDGEKAEPYREGDATNPINVYGQSKLLGEAKVLAGCPDALVTRVSWVFGPDKPGFPAWLVGQVRERERVEVPGDKVACPTYAEDYAELLEPLLARGRGGGVLHLCNEGAVSWYDYASEIVAVLRERGVELRVRDLVPTRSAEVANFVAPRPLQTAMSVAAYGELTGRVVPPWQTAIRRHLEDLVSL